MCRFKRKAPPVTRQMLTECLARLLQVKFVSQTQDASLLETHSIVLPSGLYDGIREAAAKYRVTQLDRYFDTIAQLGPSAQWLAERLRECKQHGDMTGIVNLITQLSQEEKESPRGESTRDSHR